MAILPVKGQKKEKKQGVLISYNNTTAKQSCFTYFNILFLISVFGNNYTSTETTAFHNDHHSRRPQLYFFITSNL